MFQCANVASIGLATSFRSFDGSLSKRWGNVAVLAVQLLTYPSFSMQHGVHMPPLRPLCALFLSFYYATNGFPFKFLRPPLMPSHASPFHYRSFHCRWCRSLTSCFLFPWLISLMPLHWHPPPPLSSEQLLYASQMVALMSIDILGASARSFLPTFPPSISYPKHRLCLTPGFCIPLLPPPYLQGTDTGLNG